MLSENDVCVQCVCVYVKVKHGMSKVAIFFTLFFAASGRVELSLCLSNLLSVSFSAPSTGATHKIYRNSRIGMAQAGMKQDPVKLSVALRAAGSLHHMRPSASHCFTAPSH